MRIYKIGIFLVIVSIVLVYTADVARGSLWIKRSKERDARYEKICIENGWQKITRDVYGIPRQLLWKGPRGTWKHGAIIVMHGGGGSYTNWGSGPRLAKPMINFADRALAQGFAVFSLDSTRDVVTDERGYRCGKRFDCLAQSRPNIDLPFIEMVIDEIIPAVRPAQSSEDVFMTGISNGGFMTILAATHFANKIGAFAPVSAGDPYGTYIDARKRRMLRPSAPGIFYDNETHKPIHETGACVATVYAHEQEWPATNARKRPPFKQFHHEGDKGVDLSGMHKAQRQLIAHGFYDDGPFIIKSAGKQRIQYHFWRDEYNQPLIEFFIRNTTNLKRGGLQ